MLWKFTAPLFAGVNSDGSYSEILPIEIPAGRGSTGSPTGAIQPRLALVYNSNDGNASASLSAGSITGIGWSLSGIPVITRMNYRSGQARGGINYDGQDTFVGPEGRLIPVGVGLNLPLQVPPQSVYHAENETWSKYEALGSDGQTLTVSNRCGGATSAAVEPCSWRVTDRSGIVYIYGGFTSTIPAVDASLNAIHSGAIRVWALRTMTDLNGNQMQVEYYLHGGQYYPKKITYTSNAAVGLAAKYAVRFIYDQSTRPDKEISYASSSYVRTAWRLKEILVEAEQPVWWIFSWTVQVRKYVLGYDTAAGLMVSRLKTWQEFDAGGNPLPAVEFTYRNDTAVLTPLSSFVITPTGGHGISMYHMLGDFNGDGKTDIIQTTMEATGSHRIQFSNGDGTFRLGPLFTVTPTGGHGISMYHMLGDFDGDGKTDIIQTTMEATGSHRIQSSTPQTAALLLQIKAGTTQSITYKPSPQIVGTVCPTP